MNNLIVTIRGLFIIGLVWLSASKSVEAAGESACFGAQVAHSGTHAKVYNSFAEIDAHGSIKGLAHKVCLFSSSNQLGVVGFDTIISKRPSIAATYLLKGVQLDKLEKLIPSSNGLVSNPADVYCQALGGSSISRYANGGFTTPSGESDMCVFGDGSMVSMWTLVYVSQDPGFLSIRAAIKSQPLPLDLPYLISRIRH